MIEKLLTCAILLDVGLMPLTEYTACLDTLFLENSEDDLLLELEFCSGDAVKTCQLIYDFLQSSNDPFSVKEFGKILFGTLKSAYNQNRLDMKGFSEKTYRIWRLLPQNLQHDEPFWSLGYADEPLSWGDEKQTRKIYQHAFQFDFDKETPST